MKQQSFISWKGAYFSPHRKYRYALWRVWDVWDENIRYVNFICLNPSTANETDDDPTIRRCVGFSRDWGYQAMFMTNLFAYRATIPELMMKEKSPIGPLNNKVIAKISGNASLTVAGWGNHGGFKSRSDEVMKLLTNPYYLLQTNKGEPSHPLYLKKDLKSKPFYPELIVEKRNG